MKVIGKRKKDPKGFKASKKDGGRAGYQIGGEVVEDVSMMRETMAAPSPTAPAQTQDLTYDELRARLPREITDDVVTLIATSKQALTDFANIQTQQDVDNFNQTYNVNSSPTTGGLKWPYCQPKKSQRKNETLLLIKTLF